jgi:hypothetical protein
MKRYYIHVNQTLLMPDGIALLPTANEFPRPPRKKKNKRYFVNDKQRLFQTTCLDVLYIRNRLLYNQK